MVYTRTRLHTGKRCESYIAQNVSPSSYIRTWYEHALLASVDTFFYFVRDVYYIYYTPGTGIPKCTGNRVNPQQHYY